MKLKREKHRAAIALPGAFFDVGGEARRRNIYVAAAGRRMCRHVWARTAGRTVKILLPGTEEQGFAGRGEQREEVAGRAEGRNPAAGM